MGSYPLSFDMTGRGLEVLPLDLEHVDEETWLPQALAATDDHLAMTGKGPGVLPLGSDCVDNWQRTGRHALS